MLRHKSFILASLTCLCMGAAYANPGNNGGGNGGCGAGQQTNGCGTSGSTINQGGAGGNGYGVGIGFGQGGNSNATGGQGGQGGHGGSVLGSGNSANVNRNTNRNQQDQAQGQAQGQLQGQAQRATAKQGQAQSSHNDNRSLANNSNSNTNNGNNAQQGQSVNVAGDNYEASRIPVATAYATPLVAGMNTCMGSTSVGGQGMTFGISVGSTWEDHGCTMRSNAQTLNSLGQPKAAIALLCQDKNIAKAMSTAGTPCPASKSTQVSATSSQQPTVVMSQSEANWRKIHQYYGHDESVIRRLGGEFILAKK